MARYRKYTISYGDTIQTISQKETGTVALWEDIVEYNQLEYPYLVDTVEEKLTNPEGLVTIGDTIIIPIEVDLLDTDVETLGNRDRELILGLALGRDLAWEYNEQGKANKGNFGEAFHLTAKNGDLEVASGVENLKNATIRRLLTPRGSMALSPNFGSNLVDILGRYNTEETRVILDNEIESIIKQDTRVEDVELIESRIEEDQYHGEFEIMLHSLQEYFSLVIEGDEAGGFVTL